MAKHLREVMAHGATRFQLLGSLVFDMEKTIGDLAIEIVVFHHV